MPTNDDLRDMLVPINKKYPLKELIDACRAYPGLSNARRITFEYVMLKDVNDSIDDAKELVQAPQGHSGQDQPDPVQPVAGHELPVLGLGDDREIRRLHQQCRLCLADPHAARPRHPRRLRPAQVGIGAHEEVGAPGARSDDDRRARRGVSRVLLYLGKFAHMVLGYAAASLAASAFLNVILLGAAGLMAADMPPEVATGSMVFSIPFVALFVAYFAFVPAVVVMLLAELLGKRDWLFHALSGGVVALVFIGFAFQSGDIGFDLSRPHCGRRHDRQRPCRRHRLLVRHRPFCWCAQGRRLFRLRREDLEREGRKHARKQIVDDARHARAFLHRPLRSDRPRSPSERSSVSTPR